MTQLDRSYWESLAKAAIAAFVIAGVTFFATLATDPKLICLVAATGSAFFGSVGTATVFDRRALGAEQKAVERTLIDTRGLA